jgi:hypothetical protein
MYVRESMRCRNMFLIWGQIAGLACATVGAQAPSRPPHPVAATCHRATIEGEVDAGKPFSAAIGSGLKIVLQPIHSGWILRVLPIAGPAPEDDYAELATPPYRSVTPLSISTDFSFRAQDAVGWNPRRFRFATSAGSARRMPQAYTQVVSKGTGASQESFAVLSSEIARSAEGTFTIVDARLVPGNADQWRAAAAVASHFDTTAHMLVEEPGGSPSPLGRLLWLRFRLQLDLPPGFATNSALHAEARLCTVP